MSCLINNCPQCYSGVNLFLPHEKHPKVVFENLKYTNSTGCKDYFVTCVVDFSTHFEKVLTKLNCQKILFGFLITINI